VAASGVTVIPKGPLNSREAMRLIGKLRSSELRRDRALKQAIRLEDQRRSKFNAKRAKAKNGSAYVVR